MSRGVTIARRIPGPKAALSACCVKLLSLARKHFPLDKAVFSVPKRTIRGPLHFELVSILGPKLPYFACRGEGRLRKWDVKVRERIRADGKAPTPLRNTLNLGGLRIIPF